MYPHRIRLRGPWEYEPLLTADAEAPLPAPGRMTMPCRWADGGLGDFSGVVRFRRRFGFPGRIDSHERVWLTFDHVSERATVALNAEPLGRLEGQGPFEFGVTGLLQARNELTVDVEGEAQRGGLAGEVALEVRCTAFLRAVQITATRAQEGIRLDIRGDLIGSAQEPLELYVIAGRSTVAYTTILATGEVVSFHLIAEKLANEAWQGEPGKPEASAVQVDLVNGAAVWYTIRQDIVVATEP